MSAAEIIRELPKLTADERSIIRQRLRELEAQDEGEFLNDAALTMFQELDQQEAEDARRKAR
ncbi:MAG: hypothetical protein ABSC03_15550 [Verrucomicrobiota bacterium]|jgi:hypothetical protein